MIGCLLTILVALLMAGGVLVAGLGKRLGSQAGEGEKEGSVIATGGSN